MDATPTKKKRERHVWGRITWRRKDGQDFVFEQGEFGLSIRRKHSREEPKILTFRKLYEMANNHGQETMI